MLAAIAVGPNREVVGWLSNVCTEMGDLCVYKTLTFYPHAHELRQILDIFSPEVVLLDVESSPGSAVELVRLVRSAYPKTAVVGFAQTGPVAKFGEVTAAGVAEILVAPFDGTQLHQTVIKAIQAIAGGFADNVIAFVPAKGGSGATTTALAVATSLAKDWQQRLLLMEADLQSGYLAFLLKLDADPDRSIIKALESSQVLTETHWNNAVWKVRGFDLAPMPTTKTLTEVTRWEYQRLLTYARSRYQTVIVDLPELPTGATEAAAAQAKTIYIVTTPDQPSLFLARRRIDELRGRGAPDQRLSIVLNRCRDKGAGLAAAEKYLGRPVKIVLPDEDPTRPPPLPAVPPQKRNGPATPPALLISELAQAYHGFAGMLAGGPPPPRPTPPPEPRKGLRDLLNRALQHS